MPAWHINQFKIQISDQAAGVCMTGFDCNTLFQIFMEATLSQSMPQ